MPKMYRPKRQQIGAAGLVVRYRNGTCAHSCRRCQHWREWPRWRTAVRFARKHDAAHYANAVRYNRTNTDHRHLDASRARRAATRRLHLGRLAVVALVLAVLAFGVSAVTTHAAPAPTAPSIVVVPTTAPGPARPPPTRTAPGSPTPIRPRRRARAREVAADAAPHRPHRPHRLGHAPPGVAASRRPGHRADPLAVAGPPGRWLPDRVRLGGQPRPRQGPGAVQPRLADDRRGRGPDGAAQRPPHRGLWPPGARGGRVRRGRRAGRAGGHQRRRRSPAGASGTRHPGPGPGPGGGRRRLPLGPAHARLARLPVAPGQPGSQDRPAGGAHHHDPAASEVTKGMAQGYVYFVSYHLGTGPQQSGIGNVEMVLPRPISRIG